MVNIENEATGKVLVEKELLELFDDDFSGCILLEFKEELNELTFFFVGIFVFDDSDFGRSDFELVINCDLIILTVD